MADNLHIAYDEVGIEKLREYLRDKDYIAFDCETTGITKHDEIIGYSVCAEDGVAYYVILAHWDKDLKKLIYYEKNMASSHFLFKDLIGKKLIMHNGVFDCLMVEANAKIKLIESLHTDTMILAHLLNENRKVGLKELAKEYFGQDSVIEAARMKESVECNGGSVTKTSYEMYKADSHTLAEYGAKDAILTYRLFHILLEELCAQNLEKFFYEDESMPLLKGPTYDLNTTGLQVDQESLTILKKLLQAECAEAKTFIYSEIAPYIKDKYPGTTKKNTFNIGSSSQLAWLLFGKLELEFSTLTDGGKEVCRALEMRLPYTYTNKRHFISECIRSKDTIYQPAVKGLLKTTRAKKVKDPWSYIQCDKPTLKKLAPRFKWIERLLEYQSKMKLLSTYVEGIEERVKYGIINPGFLQHGTTSGRYSSRNPNFQNLPRDDKRIKQCIVARPGKILVGADYSQLEPRTFAYFSQDKRLMESFEGDDDFYSVIGMEVYEKIDCIARKDGSPDAFGIKYKRLRDLSKIIALASTYGATAHQLAPTTGKSIDDTQEDIDNYFEKFPGVRQMMLDSHKEVKNNGQVINLFGRPRRIPEAMRIDKLYGPLDHAELPYQARNLLNLAVNHKIQSTAASICNRAAIAMYNNCKLANIDCKIVLQVHDSLIIECDKDDADNVSVLLQYAMEETVQLKGVKLQAIPKIGNNLAEV